MSKGVPISQRFKGIDMFGSQVKLTYQKAYKFTTHFGAFGTIIMYTLVIGYAVHGLIKVLSNEVDSI